MSGAIQVTVHDARTHQPLSGAALVVNPGDHKGKPGNDPSVLTASVMPGHWNVEVTHAGYDPFYADRIYVIDFNTTEVRVSLLPEGSIT